MAVLGIRSKAMTRLVELGVIPPRCTKFALISEANSIVKIVSETIAEEDQLQAIAAAFEEYPEEIAMIDRENKVVPR